MNNKPLRPLLKRFLVLALASFVGLPACVSDELGAEEIESTEAALDNRFEPDLTCHIPDFPGGPIIGGTKGTDGWCCGEKLCDDRESCGEDYGKYTQACADCHFFECIPGSGEGESGGGNGGGIRPPVYHPPGGGVLAP